MKFIHHPKPKNPRKTFGLSLCHHDLHPHLLESRHATVRLTLGLLLNKQIPFKKEKFLKTTVGGGDGSINWKNGWCNKKSLHLHLSHCHFCWWFRNPAITTWDLKNPLHSGVNYLHLSWFWHRPDFGLEPINSTYLTGKFTMWLYGCFLKWWYPQNTSKWSFLVGKPIVVG